MMCKIVFGFCFFILFSLLTLAADSTAGNQILTDYGSGNLLTLWKKHCSSSKIPDNAKVLIVDNQNLKADDGNPGTSDLPFKHIQAAADKVQPGEVIVVKEGIYRECVLWTKPGTKEKPIKLMAMPGETVVIKGSVLVKGWENLNENDAFSEYKDSNIWVKRNWTRANIIPKDEPGPKWWLDYIFHDRPRVAFWKDAPLAGAGRIAPAFTPIEFEQGRLFHDSAGKRLYIWLHPGIDPNIKGIEVCLRNTLLSKGWEKLKDGKDALDFVTIQGFQFRHAGTRSVSKGAAVRTTDGNSASVMDCIISWNDNDALYVRGKNNRTLRNILAYNGQGGLTGAGDKHLFEDNIVMRNNLEAHTYFNNAGGGKLTRLTNAVFRRHKALYNNGSGLWLDIECNDNLFEDSIFNFNTGAGLDIEISRRNLVRNCIFAYNVPRPTGYKISVDGGLSRQRSYEEGDGGWGLTSRSSDGTEVYNCLFDSNVKGGLLFIASGRTWMQHDGKPVVHKTSGKNLVSMNNIFCNNGNSQLSFNLKYHKDLSGYQSDYNLFWGSKHVNGYPSLAKWSEMTGFDKHSVIANPNIPFGVAGFFTLPSTSPAVDAGTVVEKCEYDINGVKRPVGKAGDIGPFERLSTLSKERRPVVPENLSYESIELTPEKVKGTFVSLSEWKPLRLKKKFEKAGNTLAPFAEVLTVDKENDKELKTAIVSLAGVPFSINSENSVLKMASDGERKVLIPVNGKADWLFFLHTAQFKDPDWMGALYKIRFDDTHCIDIPFIEGRNITDFNSKKPDSFFAREMGSNSEIAWQGKNDAGEPVTIFKMAWPNPRPDVTIKDIQLRAPITGWNWAVIGITAGKKKEAESD